MIIAAAIILFGYLVTGLIIGCVFSYIDGRFFDGQEPRSGLVTSFWLWPLLILYMVGLALEMVGPAFERIQEIGFSHSVKETGNDHPTED